MVLARNRIDARGAFTLIELIAVIVVLTVLSAVAVPKYFDHVDRARTSALEGALGGVRSGIANFYAKTAVEGNASYPTARQIRTQGDVLQELMPRNPYNNMNTVQRVTDRKIALKREFDGSTGWRYFVDNRSDPPVAVFWANSHDKTTALGGRKGDRPVRANEL